MTGFVADSGTISDDCRLFSGEQQAKWKMIQQNGLREDIDEPFRQTADTSQRKLSYAKCVVLGGIRDVSR